MGTVKQTHEMQKYIARVVNNCHRNTDTHSCFREVQLTRNQEIENPKFKQKSNSKQSNDNVFFSNYYFQAHGRA